jgi:putative tryptophan/tyrosine transport system substrate-binding protein
MRTIIALLLIIALLALAEGVSNAQQPASKIPRIGWISLFGRNPPNLTALVNHNRSNIITAFVEGLSERGYIEGQNIIIEYRSPEGREDRLPEIAAELVRLKVDVIFADTNAATDAAQKATTTTPIVFMHGDPIGVGLVPSLDQPKRNLTGLSVLSFPLAGKRLELLKEAFPKISRAAIFLNPDGSAHKRQYAEMEGVAQALGVQLQALKARDPEPDFERLFQAAISQRANALLTLPNPIVSAHRKRVLNLAAKNRMPTMYPESRFTDAGGLMSYGPNLPNLYRRAAFYVDKILKGAKPADLPVEQPTKFELVINLKTAKTLGLTISSKMLMWADRVIGDGGQMPEKSVTTTYSSEGQRSAQIRRIGVLMAGSGNPDLEVFRQKLGELGWIDGQNIAFEYRGADGNDERFPALAAELLRLNVDIIVANSTRGARAAQQLTKTTPIVTTAIPGPLESGLVDSLHRPGRNVTGLSFMRPELGGKRLELLKEIIPGLSRVAVLSNVANIKERSIKEIEFVARSLRVQLLTMNVQEPNEFENAFSSMVRGKVGALSVLTQSMLVLNRKRIVKLTAKNRLPAMYPDSRFTDAAGLMSYGPKHADLYRRAAIYVDKILKGAKPADLPVEQPTKFELVINLKTAEHIGLTIPPNVLMWADRVIK